MKVPTGGQKKYITILLVGYLTEFNADTTRANPGLFDKIGLLAT